MQSKSKKFQQNLLEKLRNQKNKENMLWKNQTAFSGIDITKPPQQLGHKLVKIDNVDYKDTQA